MPQAYVKDVPRTLEGWRALWRFTDDPFGGRRWRTREVRVGDVGIGGSNPIRVQSMTIADTMDTRAVVDEIEQLAAAGSEIVRVTTPNRSAAENLRPIRAALRERRVSVPLVADVHFTPQAALIAAEHVEKVRINPGNYADRKHFKKWEYTDAEYARELERLENAFKPLVLCCKERGVAMRIGTNHGSLSDRILNRYGDTPAGMVESALEFVRICEMHGYHDIVLSMKASDVKVMVEAYRLLARRQRELDMSYPLHLGVTEAGSGLAARVKSCIGIATLLDDGLGDTVRVSLTEDSVYELPVARALARTFVANVDDAPNQSVTRPVPRWDPCAFERRTCEALGNSRARLAHDQPPRIELVLQASRGGVASELRALESSDGAGHDVDLVLVGVERTDDIVALAGVAQERAGASGAALGAELPLERLEDTGVCEALARAPWARVSVHADFEMLSTNASRFASLVSTLDAPLQYTLRTVGLPSVADVQRLAAAFADGLLPPGAMALDLDTTYDAVHTWRAVLAAWPHGSSRPPVVLRGPAHVARDHRVDAHVTEWMLRISAGIGGVLTDGIGDAVQLHAAPDFDAAELAREILQSTRMRLSQADFIACPSCGRTQFDLQTTTAHIQEKLRHLKGLKIAVMGCIVNGPGEMADADFGYVGSGPGRIDLYVGHERVERNVPQSEAVERLIDLIRRHGRWQEAGA